MTDEQEMNLKSFKSKNKPKAPVYEHLDEIYELRDIGFISEQIIRYLKDNYQVQTSSRTLSRLFSNRNRNENQSVPQEETVAPLESKSNVENSKASAFFQKPNKG